MLNSTIQLKVQQRLNKLASKDYNNLSNWQIVEAFNKGQVGWVRRNLHGSNAKQEGDEQSTSRIDDLNILLTTLPITLTDRKTYYESLVEPSDYMRWKRISANLKNDCCPKRPFRSIYLVEQGNLDILLNDKDKQPNFEWSETFATREGNKIQIYTNGLFEVVDAELTYYRQPRRIEILGSSDPYTMITSPVEVLCEFKDDLIDAVLIDEAVKILSGDIESLNQLTIATNSVEGNN